MENIVRRAHSLAIKEGQTTVTGVTQVVSLGDKEVRLVVGDRQLCLLGQGFAAEKLSIEEGLLVLGGEVRELKYLAKQEAKSFLKRLFK